MSALDVADDDVERLIRHAHRVEREGKTEIAEVIYFAASEIARLRQQRDPSRFVDFVLRHTWPERAKAHGHDVVHALIKHHPFARLHCPSTAPPATGAADAE